jgi:hypothetical protein
MYVRMPAGYLVRQVPKRFRTKKDRHREFGLPNEYGPRRKAQ